MIVTGERRRQLLDQIARERADSGMLQEWDAVKAAVNRLAGTDLQCIAIGDPGSDVAMVWETNDGFEVRTLRVEEV